MSERPNWEEMTDEEIEAACDAAECDTVEQELERRFREEVEASERLEHMRYETRNDGKGERP